MEVSQPLDHITHAVIGGSTTIDFGISNSAEFFDILSRTLYTDQILAVVREVLCNAWDAHIEAGCADKPIKIELDSEHFVVTDFGYGIPRDKIGPIYGVYGASTKTNDGLQTGGFGLGCKAPFAYTDHFEVTSSNNGTRTIYNMSKSNAVAKGKPGIIPLASFPTTETGLRVKIPIMGKDWPRFKELAQRIVSNGEMLAELNNELLPNIPFSKCEHDFLLTTKHVMGTANQYHHNFKKLLLRYGNVIYPVERTEEIGRYYDAVSAMLIRFDHYYLILQAPPDSISVTPSRESLSMQEHTVNTLNKLFKSFITYTKGLDDETFLQGKQRVAKEIAKKSYHALFNQGWGFVQTQADTSENINELKGMASFQLTKSYPVNIKFRVDDIDFRVREATKAKIIDSHLATTFLEKLPEVKKLPSLYYQTDRGDWLHRRVLSKVIMKLRMAKLDDTALFVIDKMQPTMYNSRSYLTPLNKVYGRNHLINLPFLRKAVVITTAVTDLENRVARYHRHHPASPTDGMLCFYARSRKIENIEAIFAVFKKMGYEIIDMTKRHSWELDEQPITLTPRKKAEPYPGLPALRNIQGFNTVSIELFRQSGAVKLPTPELVFVIGARNNNNANIDGFTPLATKALIKLYGDRVGIAKDMTEYKRALKYGATDFMATLETEMEAMLTTSPTVAEYLAFDYIRVKGGLLSYVSNLDALRLIYKDNDLRKEFGLTKNLTEEEEAMLNIYNYSSTGLSNDRREAIQKFIDTIPMSPINKIATAAVTDNDLLAMLSITTVNKGLKSAKRQIYLDVITKVLKG